MVSYHQQLRCAASDIDLEFWKAPQGVTVPDDELSFLLVPDAVEALAVFNLAKQVHEYQSRQIPQGKAINCALMVTMGGMLPGILFYDHLVQGRPEQTPAIEFGTIGVSLYKGPDERHSCLQVQQEISIPVLDATVLVIDDLGDRGDTMQFLKSYISKQGAKEVLTLALYMKPAALKTCPVDFYFGAVAQDTWIITPREAVETMVRRVPVWRERGANEQECHRRLVELIGYPTALVDYYLPGCFSSR